MSAYIKYGDFVFPSPLPLVSKTEERVDAGGRWAVSQSITIDGQITGLSQNDIYSGRYSIITGLSKSYREFLVIEDTSGINPKTSSNGKLDAHGNLDRHYWPAKDSQGNPTPSFNTGDGWSPVGADVVVSGAFTRVDDISFDENKYFSNGGVLNYSVSLQCFNPETFNNAFRVINPVDSIEYSESEENIVEVSHKVSAQGINAHFSDWGDTGNAFAQAKAWVSTRTGNNNNWQFIMKPILISGRNIGNAVLMSQNESIDRIAGTYSVDEKWQYNPSGHLSTKSFQKYSFSISSGSNDDYHSVDTSLDIKGGLDISLVDLRNEVPSINNIWTTTTGETLLTGISYFPNSYKVKEDEDAKTITVSASFDNNTGSFNADPTSIGFNPFFDYGVSVEEDSISQTCRISIDGSLTLRKNQLYSWNYLQTYFDEVITTKYLYDKATGHFADLNTGNHPLNPNPSSYSVTEKSGVPSINVNITFSDEDWVTGYSEANWNISQTPSIAQYKSKASAFHNGDWVVPYLGYYNREKIGFSYNFKPEMAGGTAANQIGFAKYYAVQYNPMRYINELREVITGAGFRHARYNAWDWRNQNGRNGNMFDDFSWNGEPALKMRDKYGVRLAKEDFSVESGDGANTMKYSYEYTKPANTNVSIRIP
jgi:hypothetical protein